MPGKIVHATGFTFNKQQYEIPKNTNVNATENYPLSPTPVSQRRGVMDAFKSDADFVYLYTDFIT